MGPSSAADEFGMRLVASLNVHGAGALLLAFNQGFYNLFLAIVTGIGIGAVALGRQQTGHHDHIVQQFASKRA
jgi:uncharacterized membrane protein